MNINTMPLEAETRVLIDRSLENLGWKLDGKDQNVYYEQPKTEAEKKKLKGKRPDYVLYSKESDKPLIVIEAKKKGARIDTALEQGIDYARAIEAPLVFATDGVFCKAFHTVANRPPILNGEEIDEFIREALALRYLTSYEVNTVSPKVQYDRKELIRIFDEAITYFVEKACEPALSVLESSLIFCFLNLSVRVNKSKKKVEFKPSLIFPAVGIVLKKFHVQQELNILIIRSMIDLMLFIVQTFLLRYKSEMRVS